MGTYSEDRVRAVKTALDRRYKRVSVKRTV
jgi:hypothetical protein